MFSNLSDRFAGALKKIKGQGRLTEQNITKALKDVRNALLEADVALPVVKDFMAHVRRRSLGQEVAKSLNPGQAFIKIVQDELTQVMGEENSALNLKTQPPAVILMAGLQGSGKTTTTAKLAKLLKERDKKKVAVVSCDVYRPAAIKQLQTLADSLEVTFIPSSEKDKPVSIAKEALKLARQQVVDVLIVDTAGRLHVDSDMMNEVKALHQIVNPVETLFVVDSMTGQDAVNTAKAFDEALALTGVILTKTDGDARGGAALSIRQVTGKPIKFLGTGEKTDGLEAFHPARVASRILGMGDMLSLIEELETNVDKEKAEKLAKKIKQGKGFTLLDLKEQIQQMHNMGGMGKLVEKLPMGQKISAAQMQMGEKQTKRMVAIIDSMTTKERNMPDLINNSRKKRIAAGSGTEIQDINKLLKQFTQMQKVMKKMGKMGMGKMMRDMGGMLKGNNGILPPGMGA